MSWMKQVSVTSVKFSTLKLFLVINVKYCFSPTLQDKCFISKIRGARMDFGGDQVAKGIKVTMIGETEGDTFTNTVECNFFPQFGTSFKLQCNFCLLMWITIANVMLAPVSQA